MFYVGVGKEGTNRHKHKRRTGLWKNVVNKNNGEYEIEIMLDGLTLEEANAKEIEFVKLYGRKKDGTGTLVNFQKGGNCYREYKMSQEQRKALGQRSKGNKHSVGYKHTKEARERMSFAHKGKPNGLKGFKHTKETRSKMSASHKGNLSNTGKISITNGSISTFISKDSEIPHGWWRGGPKKPKMSTETRRKMSESRKGKPLNLTEEQKQRKSESMKGNKSCQGFIWITNGVESKLLKNENEIPLGWKRGRTKKAA